MKNGWNIYLENGEINCLYNGEIVFKRLRLMGVKSKSNTRFFLEYYGKPYRIRGGWYISIFRLVSEENGPTDILMEAFCGVNKIMLRLYPKKRMLFKLRGLLNWGIEPYLCRIEPGFHSDVVQAALGPVDSLLCNSIFDKLNDRVIRLTSWGDLTIHSLNKEFEINAQVLTQFGVIPEILVGEVIENYVSSHLGMPYYKPYDLKKHPYPPAGWCSWYYYGKNITEKDVIANTDWISQNLKKFGLEYIQLDDGYQDETWLKWNKNFPRGGKWLAQYIKSRGLKPGLWLLPQAVGKRDTKLLTLKPHWFIRKPDGRVFRGFANYPYIDPTNPEVVKEWIEKTMDTLANKWGYEYFKLDGQGEMHQWYALCRDSLYNKSINPDKVYRGLLEIIRKIIGDEKIILICATQWRAIGYGDTCRTGTDVSSSKLREGTISFLNALRATFSNYWMHTILWYCDPDVIMVRSELPFEAAKMWVSLLGLSGQVLMISDNMLELSNERIELLKKIIPPLPIRPMDLFPRKPEPPYPQIWDLKIATKWGKWDIVGVFRWFKEDPAKIEISCEKLGLPKRRYIVYEIWEKKVLGELDKPLYIELQPESCKVLCIRPLENIPLFLGTDRHITQGYPDILKLNYIDKNIIEGESLSIENEPYQINFLINWDGEKYSINKIIAEKTNVKYQIIDKNLLTILLKSNKTGKIKWRIEFKNS